MGAKWTAIAELKWSKDGRLMVRKQGEEFQNARTFLEAEYVGADSGPSNLFGCRIGPPKPPTDLQCVSIPVDAVRPADGGCEVKLPGGEVVDLDSLFSLEGRGPSTD